MKNGFAARAYKFVMNRSGHTHRACSRPADSTIRRYARLFLIIISVAVACMTCGCGRGYISSYSDNINKSSYSLTSVSAEFCSFVPLLMEDTAVPGEGAALDIGDVYAAGLFDLDGGKTVIEENLTKKLYPASMTKIMTALLAIKYGDPAQKITASTTVSRLEWEAQRIGIEPGDRMTLEQALNYLMVYSANDAAVLIAETIGKNYKDFVRMMNEEAARIGATNTHFTNPHGLHNNDHYTTAYDLFLIFRECLKYPEFRALINQNYYSTSFKSRTGEARYIEVPSTDNYLTGVSSPPAGIQVIGGKTGTTDQARSCLIILSKNADGREFVSTIFGAPDHSSLYVFMNNLLRQERGYPDGKN